MSRITQSDFENSMNDAINSCTNKQNNYTSYIWQGNKSIETDDYKTCVEKHKGDGSIEDTEGINTCLEDLYDETNCLIRDTKELCEEDGDRYFIRNKCVNLDNIAKTEDSAKELADFLQNTTSEETDEENKKHEEQLDKVKNQKAVLETILWFLYIFVMILLVTAGMIIGRPLLGFGLILGIANIAMTSMIFQKHNTDKTKKIYDSMINKKETKNFLGLNIGFCIVFMIIASIILKNNRSKKALAGFSIIYSLYTIILAISLLSDKTIVKNKDGAGVLLGISLVSFIFMMFMAKKQKTATPFRQQVSQLRQQIY